MIEYVADGDSEIDALRAENERLQGDWQLAVKIAETHALENERLRAALRQIRELVDRQAEDEALWFLNPTIEEAYLQQELRNLHDRIERLGSW